MWSSLVPSAVAGPVQVGLLHHRVMATGQAVTATVAGRRVWFRSDAAPLTAASEAFGAAFLVPAMHASRPLALRQQACPTWTGHLAPLTAAFRDLWYPEAPEPIVSAASMRRLPATGTALCFSGGADSFHALLAGGATVDALVYVAGYDVNLRDVHRLRAVDAMLRDVAAACGARAVWVQTNLRRHPLVRSTPWLREFGAALAAVGHLLTPTVGRLLIASDGLGFEHPEVGARPATDPLLGSASLRVEHVAATITRLEKLRAIASEPIVQRHLRVCWANVAGRSNCGRCEKCVRTMLCLDACGALGRFAGFDRGRHLVEAIDALPGVTEVVEPFYREVLRSGVTGRPAEAVRRLLARPREGRAAHGGASMAPSRSRRHRLLGPEAFAQVCQPLVGKRVGYVRPIGNVGDHLIELAMTQLFAAYGIRWTLVATESLRPSAVEADVLVFGGGGNMGGRYRNNYDLRSLCLATGIPLVILPQSFTTPEDRAFHRVHVRERGSLCLRPDGILSPDLALGLSWSDAARPARDLGIFLRRDQERRGCKPFLIRDPVRMARTPAEYLALAARHRRIVTDRLHFAIAGLHAGRDVTLVANDYHKNQSMHETWLASLGCRFAASAEESLRSVGRAA